MFVSYTIKTIDKYHEWINTFISIFQSKLFFTDMISTLRKYSTQSKNAPRPKRPFSIFQMQKLNNTEIYFSCKTSTKSRELSFFSEKMDTTFLHGAVFSSILTRISFN